MKGWVIQLEGQGVPLTYPGKKKDETLPYLPYSYGERLYVPLREILAAHQVVMVSSDSLDQLGYAFALGEDLYRITYQETREGEPTQLGITKNGEAQLLLNQDIRQADGCDYLPTDILTAVMGLSFQQDSQGLILTVSFPAPAEG